MEGEPESVSRRRRWLTWLVSLLGGALFLWLASGYLELWPSRIAVVSWGALGGAVACQIPYAVVRSMRLQFMLDPIVRAQAKGGGPFDRRALYGSGFVSFWVLLALPLKLGELSRPLLIARANQPGVGVPEAVAAVGVERLVDGLIICGMLFGGLALGRANLGDQATNIRSVGLTMLGVGAVGVGAMIWAARDPAQSGALAGRLATLVSPAVGALAERVSVRVAGTMQQVLVPGQGGRLVAWSLVYWAITTAQMWLVMRATGLSLGVFEAAAVVAIVGLSIQLPGGPAQAGTFQVGMLLALALFGPAEVIEAQRSAFVAMMYLLQFFGAAGVALPGLWLMARLRRPSEAQSATS